MELSPRQLGREELPYGYEPSRLIGMVTGHIGHLRVDFDTDGKGFFTSWNDHLVDFKTAEFQTDLDTVVGRLRKDPALGMMLQNLQKMNQWGYDHPEMKVDEYYYGMRVDSEQYSYICRLDPRQGAYNGYIYCYHQEAFNDYLESCQRGIHYTEKSPYKRVELSHNGMLDIQNANGEALWVNCKYYGERDMVVTHGLHEEVVQIAQYFQGLRDKGMTYTSKTGIYTEQDLENKHGTYAIYQLSQGEKYHNYRFAGLDELGTLALKPLSRKDYNLVYVGTAHGNDERKLLNQLYDRFNSNHPMDFSGHSLSVSDVIALNMDGKISYHYVDTIGFQKIPFVNHMLEKESPITQLVDLAKTDLEGLVNALSTYENRTAVETALNMSQLKSQLETPVSFDDLVTLNSFCQDTWLKTEGLEFIRVQDFVAEAINENIATIDQLVSLSHREFGIVALDGDVESLQQRFTPQQAAEGFEGKLSVMERLQVKPEPRKPTPQKPKEVER